MNLERHSCLTERTAFRERVQVRAARRKLQTADALRSQHIVEGGAELSVAVMQDVTTSLHSAATLIDRIAGHLCHPGLRRVSRYAGDGNAPRF